MHLQNLCTPTGREVLGCPTLEYTYVISSFFRARDQELIRAVEDETTDAISLNMGTHLVGQWPFPDMLLDTLQPRRCGGVQRMRIRV